MIRVFRVATICWFVFSNAIASADYITGTVKNQAGKPEGGVWVIAETEDLKTDYRKIVVTNNEGQFVLPELPKARYDVWVRGYGLNDSDKMQAMPGDNLKLLAESAETQAEAAMVYPASYWLAMMAMPAEQTFSEGSAYPNQQSWRSQFKLNCVLCHQLGVAATRLADRDAFDHGLLKAAGMNYFADTLGRDRLLTVLGDWSERIASGETPKDVPPRPTGIETQIVITQWAWGDSYTYAHDEVATDKRTPTVNANGPVYGVDLANDYLLKVDPLTHSASRIKVPTRGGFKTPWCAQTYKAASSEKIEPFGFGSLGCPWPGGETPHLDRYDNPANPHNPMMDANGRVWLTTQIRRQWAEDLPEFCQADPVVATRKHHRQLGYYDPKLETFVLVDTCFGTHHLQFDNRGVLWTSGDDFVVGWLDTNKYDPKNPNSLADALGYSEVRIDDNGDGKANKAVTGFQYGVIPNPVDGSVWSAVPPGLANPTGGSGWLSRYDPAKDSHEIYAPPLPGRGPRGVDVDSKGVIWTALAGSGHLARFDRSACKQHWGSGLQCPEAWTLWQTPGPQFSNVDDSSGEGNVDMHYYLWIDQFDILGLGVDTVVINGTGSDSLIAFEPDTEKFTVIRIPYPLNTYTRGLDGRIDDPNAGWKGRGLWFTNGLDPIIHSEIPQSYVGKVQLRPNALAH